MKIIAQNKKAFHEYDILDRIEAGIVLTGNEVKSVRAGQVSLIGSFATPHKGELFLVNAMISIYSHAYTKKEEEGRASRKLLLHKRELTRLFGDISKKGITIVPLKLYINERGKIKVELGVAKHKKAHGIKEAIKERDIERQTRRELSGKYKY